MDALRRAGHEEKERVRDASDIVRVIGEHVSLKAKGREFMGVCPFHDDHDPSMHVVPGKQIFHCFVCGAGGDVFAFVQRFHQLEFREAIEYLAQRANIALLPRTRAAQAAAEGADAGPTRADLVWANGVAASYFQAILRHGEHGRAAREAIAARGISAEMVEAFALGASADRWDGLATTIRGKQMPNAAFVATGLLRPRESDGSFYDGFRNRLIFPIHDQLGRVIAFGARKLKAEDEPKYLNSPESAIFEKSGTLYGLHLAARAIQTVRVAVVTEGYTDTIACHQAGLSNVVATLGTALTARHARVLRRLCDTVILLFDGDEAGMKAADRAVEVFFAEDLDVRIATLSSVTDAKDPDELLKRPGGVEVLRQVLSAARDLLEFRCARLAERVEGAGPAVMSRKISEELERLVQIGFNRLPLLRRRLITRRIAEVVGLDETTVWQSVPVGRSAGSASEPARPTSQPSARELALGCLLAYPDLWSTLTDRDKESLDPAMWEAAEQRAVAEATFDAAASGAGVDLEAVRQRLEDAGAQAAATGLYMRVMAMTEGRADRGAECLRDCLGRLTEDGSGVDVVRDRRATGSVNRRALPRPTRAV
ncbi:MAG: DNA primase [Phycisphaerales bacterium]